MRNLLDRIWAYARSHTPAFAKTVDRKEEESWLGI